MESGQKQKIILDECSRMSKLVQSMLALASSDAGNWKMDIRETDVDTLLIETWEKFSESARKKNIRLTSKIITPRLTAIKSESARFWGFCWITLFPIPAPDRPLKWEPRCCPKSSLFSSLTMVLALQTLRRQKCLSGSIPAIHQERTKVTLDWG